MPASIRSGTSFSNGWYSLGSASFGRIGNCNDNVLQPFSGNETRKGLITCGQSGCTPIPCSKITAVSLFFSDGVKIERNSEPPVFSITISPSSKPSSICSAQRFSFSRSEAISSGIKNKSTAGIRNRSIFFSINGKLVLTSIGDRNAGIRKIS